MTDITKDLEALGFKWVEKIANDAYVMRSNNGRLLVCWYDYNAMIGEKCWSVEISNVENTRNCYVDAEQMLEALKNYLNPDWRK